MGRRVPSVIDASALQAGRPRAAGTKPGPRGGVRREGAYGLMKRTLLAHVGVPKAGSASIQNLLLTRVRALARCGIHVPRAGSTGGIVGEHNALAVGLGKASSGPDHWQRLAQEIRRSRASRFVTSAEHLSARNRWRCAEREPATRRKGA